MSGMSRDAKVDAMQEIGEVTLTRLLITETVKHWHAFLDTKHLRINGQPRDELYGTGFTPDAAINALWEQVAGYKLILDFRRGGQDQKVRWNGVWQQIIDRPELTFTFRNILRTLGIPLSNATNWQAGQVLRKFAAASGIEPMRLMADKTDPNATVQAQHVIAHYPMSFFPDALAYFRDRFEEERKQYTLFEDAV